MTDDHRRTVIVTVYPDYNLAAQPIAIMKTDTDPPLIAKAYHDADVSDLLRRLNVSEDDIKAVRDQLYNGGIEFEVTLTASEEGLVSAGFVYV